MAYKQIININGTNEPAVNIRWNVGPGAPNGPADVMLIQTFINYLSFYGKTPTSKHTGLGPGELPAMDGKFGPKTARAVLQFQRQNARFLQNVDGIVHPASYNGRNLSGRPRYMTITLMHLFGQERALMENQPSYIDGLIRLNPALKGWLA